MIIQAFFGSAQTGVGYQFYDATGALIGSRITAGIVTLPGAGAFMADATVPAGTAGVYWNTDATQAHEDLRDALALEIISLDAIADAVLDEIVNEHEIPGSVGVALAASGASGDPWITLLPGSYAEGTAGAAIGRLNNTPAETPIALLPDPLADPDLAILVVDTEEITGQPVINAEITVTLSSVLPLKTAAGRILASGEEIMKHSSDTVGRYTISVEKGATYTLGNVALFGREGFTVHPTEDVVSINSQITSS